MTDIPENEAIPTEPVTYIVNSEGNGKTTPQAILSLIFGIVGLVSSVFCPSTLITLGFSIAALVLASTSKKKSAKPEGQATAGKVCGIVALSLYGAQMLLSVLILLFIILIYVLYFVLLIGLGILGAGMI